MNISLRRFIFVLGIFMLGITVFISSPLTVQAANIQVDIDTDDNLAALNQLGDGPCSLREAINNAINDAAVSDDCPAGSGDDVIDFAGVYTIVISNNVSAGVISVNTNITINGDVTLDGNNQNNIFLMSGTGDIVLDNITFINGNANGGGAILVTSPTTNLTITDSNFDGNNADGNGGAISSSGGLSIFDTIFQNNTADVEGGAIYQSASSPMTIQASGFMSNTAGVDNNGRGGAIYHSESSLLVSTITASYFDENIADNADSADGGGAIFHNGGQLLITASAFSGNNADGADARGGAINNSSTDDFALEINYSHFGETLSFPLPLPAPLNVLSLTDPNTVTGTSAATSGGGAIYNFGSMEITAVSFIGNSSSSHGGAIFSEASTDDDGTFDGDEIIIANSTFYDNTATGNGGAIYQDQEDDIIYLMSLTIADNSAASGAAIFNTGDGESPGISNFDDISIVNSIIANNGCAGGELGNGNMNASGNNVVFNSTCAIVQQDGSSTTATPITADPVLLAPSLEFSLGALLTFVMEIDTGSSASGTGDPASCSAFPVIDLDQRGLPLGIRPQGAPNCDIGAYESSQVPPEPEIDVLGNAISIVDGDTTPDVTDDTDFGSTTIGTAVMNTFTIENTGTADLTITIPLGNSDAVNFTLTDPATTVAAGGSTTFNVTCNATSIGNFTTTITITNNDSDENPYTFDITCQVDGIPEIDVLGNAISIVDGDNTPSVTDDTDFGSTTNGMPISNTFTIENTGSADLTGINVTLPVGFSLTTPPAAIVTAGNSTTFTVQCAAASVNTFTGTVSIANNDSDENPYTFDITCDVTAAPAPEIDVQGGGLSIVDADNTPSLPDDTDFGTTTVATAISSTFTIENTGTDDLTGISVSVPADFTLTAAPPATLSAGNSVTFTVECDALTANTFTGTVSVASNDSDENPYTFDITCDVTGTPEIDVLGNAISIVDGDNTPDVTDDTDFGTTTVGTPISSTFTIENTGTDDLTGINVTVPANFTLTTPPAATVAAGNSTTFTVQCNAASASTFTGIVSIASNDADENPYTFDITCLVNPAPAPEIDVLGNAISIVDGDNTPALADDTDFGSTPMGTAISSTFTIENLGTADLTGVLVSIPADFTLTATPAGTVTAGNSTTFTIECDAASVNVFTGTVSIASNDSDENPYTFDITCNVTAGPEPEIDIQGNGLSVVDGDNTPSVTDDTDFGSTPMGTAISSTFTIENTGTADLTGINVTVPADFTLTATPAGTVTAGNSTTFTVECDAASVNVFTGTVSIASNDSDENPYTFDITCNVTAGPEPEIDVQGNGLSIVDGDNTPSVTDDTDFGVTTVGTPISSTFTIANVGTADLTGVLVSVPADFTLTATPAGTVTAGNTTTFTVECDAASVNTFSGTVSITSNDTDENPYTFDITCLVNAVPVPEIDVQGNAISIVDGDNTPDVTDDTDFGTTTVGTPISSTFTIENLGTADLTGINATVPAGFSLTTPPAGTVTAGNTTTFTVQCNAASANTFTGTVSIASNDTDENPYTFDITCLVNTAPTPEINLLGGGISIADGDTTPALADDTDFGSTPMGTAISSTFTIENLGTADLTGVLVSVPADFTLTATPAGTVTAGNTTTFTVECNAASVNVFTGTVSIASNDSDENPYTFDITCNVTAGPEPEIDIQGNGLSIVDGDNTPSVTDDTDFGSTPVGTPVTHTFTIENTGSADLLITLPIVVTDTVNFSIVDPGTPVASGGNTTFSVTCNALSVGVFTTVVSIDSNDSDESRYSFDITCNVTAGPEPEIDVQGNGLSIVDGDSTPSVTDDTDFGSTIVGTPLAITFTIENVGTADLTSILVTVPTDFTLTLAPAGTVTAGNTTTFTVECDALTANTFSGTVSIASDDSDENPYTFAITCLVTAAPTPGYTSAPFAPAANINFGSVLVGNFVDRTLTISENGTDDLELYTITIAGAGFSIQSITPAVPFTIVDNSGGTVVVVLRCTPAAAGTITGTLTVTHNAGGQSTIYPLICNGTTTGGGGGSSTGSSTQINVFDPAISKIGFLLPGQLGVTGETLEWVVTVSNVGGAAGTNVTVSDTLVSQLQILRVEAPGATVTISGQTVTVVYPSLAVGQTVTFSIFTLVTNGVSVSNTACVISPNECATAQLVRELPSTGENPWWYWPVLVLFVSITGLAIFGLRRVLRKA